jgi:hypothetical protein
MTPLTQAQALAHVRYDPDTGGFFWVVAKGRRTPGDRAGYQRHDGYWFVKIAQRKYCAHRLAWLCMTGGWPKQVIDHRDRNPSNNCWSNLRDVSQGVNAHNRSGAQSNNRLGVLGVSLLRGGKYGAFISLAGKHKNLGAFSTLEAAATAYAAAKRSAEDSYA